jgi:hypothetical protein
MLLVLKNRQPGASVDPEAAQRLGSLPAVSQIRWNCAPAEPAPAVAGLAWLVDEDGAQVTAAESAIRELERSGLYRPAPEPRLAAARTP